jgi:hypothetical protein
MTAAEQVERIFREEHGRDLALVKFALLNTALHRAMCRMAPWRHVAACTPAKNAGAEPARSLDEQQDCRGGTATSRRLHALRAVRQFLWLKASSVKAAFSRPTHATRRVTPTVSLLRGKQYSTW